MKVFTSEQIKFLEDATVVRGISKLRLMENAGSAAARIIRQRFDLSRKTFTIVCGNGNNGGDGFVIARKLFENGAQVNVIRLLGLPVTENSSAMCKKLMECGVHIYDYFDDTKKAKSLLEGADVIVDAVFGIGFNRTPDTAICNAFKFMSSLSAYRIAIDIPSGIYCDTALCSTDFFKADMTISFIGYKRCHIHPPASSFCGEVINCAIGVPEDLIESVRNCPEIIEAPTFPKRDKNSHKGSFGTAVVIAGSYGMAGAAILSTRAALRSGAGLVKTILPDNIYPIVAGAAPEAVFVPVETGDKSIFNPDTYLKINTQLQNANAVLFGCGVGKGNGIDCLLRDVILNYQSHIVIDADGINALSCNIDIIKQSKKSVVLTPHPGEMARLCKTTSDKINSDRIGYATRFAKEYGVTVVLKGANTVVAFPDSKVYINTAGNPGMATGGSGDVLAGMMVSFLAQGMSVKNAVLAAVYLHSKAGDIVAKETSQISLLPGDIIEALPRLFKSLEG